MREAGNQKTRDRNQKNERQGDQNKKTKERELRLVLIWCNANLVLNDCSFSAKLVQSTMLERA
jgi:hypothetical protein